MFNAIHIPISTVMTSLLEKWSEKMKISQENHHVLVDSVTFKSDLMYIIYHLFGAYMYGGQP